MHLFADAVSGCVSAGLLVRATPHADVYWTPSLAAKLAAAGRPARRLIVLDHPDMIVGSYDTLGRLRQTLRAEYPGLWAGTDIHHVVENQHLQFLAGLGGVDDVTYQYQEPCVLLPQDGHRLLMHSLIDGAVALELERPAHAGLRAVLSAYEKHRAEHPVPAVGARATRTEKARHRAHWVAAQPPGTRKRLAEFYTDVYRFAYHQASERPLDRVAVDAIRALGT